MVACFEYRTTDIGPYNVACSGCLACKRPGDRIPALYVSDLPVTTTLAHRAGPAIRGYNKFVAPIDVQGDDKTFATALRDPDDALILTLEGARAASIPTSPMDVPTFSMLGGRASRTIILTMTPFQISSGDGRLEGWGIKTPHGAQSADPRPRRSASGAAAVCRSASFPVVSGRGAKVSHSAVRATPAFFHVCLAAVPTAGGCSCGIRHPSALSRLFASFRSTVSNPSVNHS